MGGIWQEERIHKKVIDSQTPKEDNHFMAENTPKTMTLRPTEQTYKDVRLVCGRLCITIDEFLRRAVARELAYNETALASTRKKVAR